MKLINQYKKTKNKLDSIKENIINELIDVKGDALKGTKPYIDSSGVKSKFIHIIKFSDLNNSWSPDDYLLGGKVKIEMDNLIKDIRGSKDLVDKLNKIVNYKNITNRKKWYFQRVNDEILIKLKEILGDNYYLIPKDTKKRNISRYTSKN